MLGLHGIIADNNRGLVLNLSLLGKGCGDCDHGDHPAVHQLPTFLGSDWGPLQFKKIAGIQFDIESITKHGGDWEFSIFDWVCF